MAKTNSLPTMSVAELLEGFPQAVSLFVHYRMACVGCAIAAFHTIAEAAAIYGVDTEQFVQELDLSKTASIERTTPGRN